MGNSLTYPAPGVADLKDLTEAQLHQLLRSDQVIARRIRTLADQRFIADALLTGRYKVEGGAVLYETGEPVFAEGEPLIVAPGGDYPTIQAYEGDLAAAMVEKYGSDVLITDESIKRRGRSPVDSAIRQSVNTTVRKIDRAALSVITSKVTASQAATAAWTSAKPIVETIELAKAAVRDQHEGFELDAIVLPSAMYAKVMATLFDANYLPKESSNAVVSGVWPQAFGLTWMTTPYLPSSATPFLLDREELGGMADEQLGGGYAAAGNGVETKSIREDDRDRYRLRVRRVTVPIVREPKAAVTITGVSL